MKKSSLLYLSATLLVSCSSTLVLHCNMWLEGKERTHFLNLFFLFSFFHFLLFFFVYFLFSGL